MIFEKIDEEKIAFVKLNRPKNMNALGMPVLKEFIEVLKEIKNNPLIRIVVITSAIKGMFSAGADVNELSKSTGKLTGFESFTSTNLNIILPL